MKQHITVNLTIVDHEVDKRFPLFALLSLEFNGRRWEEIKEFHFKVGDTGLEPHHLSRLFISMGNQLKKELEK